MASAFLSDARVVSNQMSTLSSSASGALCEFEKNMFGGSAAKEQDNAAHEANPDSLSYLFSIFAY